MEGKGDRKGIFSRLSRLLLFLNRRYDRLQKSEIILGENKGLPTYFYKDSNFDWMQMREIRLGLEKGLDVNSYAKLNNSVEQMEEIRLGLEKGLDVSFYNKADFDWMQMREIRLGIEKGLDVSYYAKSNLELEQMEEISLGLDKGLDVSIYNNTEFSKRQMREIRLGLEKELDISFYDNPNLDWKKMREIRLGIEQGVDIHQYLRKDNFELMKKSREQQLKESFLGNKTSYITKQPVRMVKEKNIETKINDKVKVDEVDFNKVEKKDTIQEKIQLTKFDVKMIFPVIGMGITERNIKNKLIKTYRDIDQAEKQADIYIKRIKKLISNGYAYIDDGKYKLTAKAIEESKGINKEFEFTSFDSNKIFGYILRSGGALTLEDLKNEINNEYNDEEDVRSEYEYIKNRIEKNVDSGYLTKNEDDSYSISKLGYKEAKELIPEKQDAIEELEIESEVEI